MQRVLLVEDSLEYQAMVKRALAGSFCELDCVPDLAQATASLESRPADLVLLDVLLPDGDGFEFCRALQASESTRQVPVIFLTGKSDVIDKVTAFSLGADDYIVKPFELIELRARVEARLNKLAARRQEQGSLRRGELHLNLPLQRGFLSKNGREQDLNLTPTEFKLLYHLASHEGQPFSRAQLLELIWGGQVHVLEHNIYTHMYSLRRKLGEAGAYIKSIPRVGYRFELN